MKTILDLFVFCFYTTTVLVGSDGKLLKLSMMFIGVYRCLLIFIALVIKFYVSVVFISTIRTLIGRPFVDSVLVHGIVEEHIQTAKVIVFKKKRRHV